MYDLTAAELIQRLVFALAIGLLIGLERGWRARAEEPGERTAGLRTYGLAALLGGVWGAIARQFADHGGAIALGVAFVIYAAAMTVFRYRETMRDQTYGATSIVALMLSFALGAYSVVGEETAAAAGAVATASILALKESLHEQIARMTWAELRSGLVLLVMSFIFLPALPNKAIDRWGAINPYELWLMTVLIAAVSFAGYVAVKLIGYRRGVAVAGLAGGLASSTAATAAMSRLASERPEAIEVLAAGAIFANAVMGPRVLAILTVVNPGFGLRLAAPLIAMALVYLIAGGVLMRRHGPAREEAENPLAMTNPLDLPAVLKFGALLAVVMILAKVATNLAGSPGAYALGLISGIADVDAMSLAMARHGATEIGVAPAALAVLLAILSNTLAKSVMAWMMGGRSMGLRFAATSALAMAAGGAALFLVPAIDGL
ncbi:MgtC/SapB family protein [Methylocystis iwaonis]|uniref:MgtC/SapB family protein n=1 Tax=Methylocystis iwaonis TaxID=2885079 RepID=UPI002E7C01F4|nr:DUF4010 domain-containing protein [Methylocystis iwaonis]